MAAKSASCCEGKICSTSKGDIAQGVWDKSSTIELFKVAIALGLLNVFLNTPLGILGIGSFNFSMVRGVEGSEANLSFC